MFSRYGRIVDIRLNRDRFTGRCKGFAFVAMAREEEVDEVRGCVAAKVSDMISRQQGSQLNVVCDGSCSSARELR
jgi:hypothetical protein